MSSKNIAKDVANVEYPKNLYCHITGYDPDDANIPENSIISRNIDMAIEVYNEEYPDQITQHMLKIIEMRYKDKMSMNEIGSYIGLNGNTIRTIYIIRFIRRMRYPKFYHIILNGTLDPNMVYHRNGKINDDDSIKKLGLSTKAYNCLAKDGIATITELCFKSDAYVLTIRNAGPSVLNEIKEKLANLNLSLAPFNYLVLIENISELGLEDELYNKLKKDNFNIIGDLIRNRKRFRITFDSLYDYSDVASINEALKTKGLSLNIKIPAQVVKKDILYELLYELSYEDACKYLLKLRTLSEPK